MQNQSLKLEVKISFEALQIVIALVDKGLYKGL
jgi:hypothetical protein